MLLIIIKIKVKPASSFLLDFNFQNNSIWVILLNLVHTGNLQFLAIIYNLADNEHGFFPKLVKYQ